METAFRPLFNVPWFGEATVDHAEPLDRMISVRFACSAAPALPTAHHSLADTNAASVSSPPEAAFTRLSEPHIETAARPAPASATSGTARRPGNARPAVAAAPAAATPTTKLRRDTGVWPWPSCPRSRPWTLSSTTSPQNAYDPEI